ncbi:MAG TPA: formate--tetrahydrofolate ligase [Firmicutes bacterium]|nr:formate--tetrahydrofolate ligase [Bacillota bacterium]
MSDIDIAKKAVLKPVEEIASELGVKEDCVEPYGKYKAKISLKALEKKEREGHLILVSALTPTAAGEGKTTVTIGLAQGLAAIGKKTAIALREPSLGPVMGMKGGATGGGYSQVLPMEEINLHFTGDLHAISSAHNLIAAVIDNTLHQRTLPIDPRRIVWPRVMDMNDRSLRHIIVGLGGPKSSFPREGTFDITAASEIMATLCLSEDYADLKKRIARIVVAYDYERKPVTVADLKIAGAVSALLKEALKPNLVQSIEHVPAFIHGGPFANIAQGTNSVLATRMAMRYADYAVTEAGFGFDLGGEKFLNIKCRYAGLQPEALVLVATVRALKLHGGVAKDQLKEPNPYAVAKGLINLEKHIENAVKFGIKPVIAINRFTEDTDEEIKAIKTCCVAMHYDIIVADCWAKGGEGARELAEKIVEVIESGENKLRFLYDLEASVEKKIETIAREIYGARSVIYSKEALADLKQIAKNGYDNLAICMAKTQYSLSDDPKLLGRPENFDVEIRQIIVNAGPGFLVPVSGTIMRMPGLPKKPAAEVIDIDEKGEISGLF